MTSNLSLSEEIARDDPGQAWLEAVWDRPGSRRFVTLVTVSKPDSAASDDGIPSALGEYKIIRRLGEGGMAEVFEGVRQRDSYRTRVAIKRIRAHVVGDPTYVKWFMNEARTTSSLSHPKIVKVFDFDRDTDGVPYLVMEFVPGVDLKQLIEHHGPLPTLPCSRSRTTSPRRWPTRTPPVPSACRSCIATSVRRTSSSVPTEPRS